MVATSLLLVLALAPAARAATPVEGNLAFASPPMLEGALALSTSDGGLDLAPAIRAGEAPRLEWASATGVAGSGRWMITPTAAGDVRHRIEADDEPLSIGAAAVETIRCVSTCRVFVYGASDAASVTARADVAAPLRTLDVPFATWGEGNWSGSSFFRVYPEGSVLAGSGTDDPLRVQGMHASAAGPLGLLLVNATLVARTADGRVVELDSTATSEPYPAPPLPAVGSVYTTRFVHLLLEDATLETENGTRTRFVASAPATLLDGALRSDDASGSLRHGERESELDHASLLLRGRFELRPEGEGATLLPAAGVVRTPVSGEAEEVVVGGFTYRALPAAAPVAAAGVAATLGGLVFLLRRFLGVLLYSRITRSEVLDNENRRRIFEALDKSPGATAADVARTVGVARVVAQHHLGMLEAHHLVVARRYGGFRRFFVAGALPEEFAASEVLSDERRRQIAELIVTRQGSTQVELAGLTGLSRRLVSYHLGRLEESGLVAVDGQWRRRYEATPRLSGLLRVALESARTESRCTVQVSVPTGGNPQEN